MIQVHLRRSLRRKVAARKASEGGYLDMDSVSLREPNNYLLSIHNNSTRRSGGRRSAQCQEVACRALEKASVRKEDAGKGMEGIILMILYALARVHRPPTILACNAETG